MGKKVIVTEKPSVAKTYANILNVKSTTQNGFLENEEYIITWCIGHLVTLSYPEVYDTALKKWSLETIPFLPQEYKYEIIREVKKQFSIIKTIYNRKDIDTIYYAGDAGREGLLIQELVRKMAGHKLGVEERVVWISSQTEEEIRRGIQEAKNISEYQLKINAGYMREIEDYALGINFSRVLSIKYQNIINRAAKTKKFKPLSVGRVMTCVLGMIVSREHEIINFTSTRFFRILSHIECNGAKIVCEWKAISTSKYYQSPLLYKDVGFLNETDADNFMLSLPKALRIKNMKQSIEKKNAPFLFNLAELQNECSHKFKISPSETLQVAQSLYEKKLITYPRTDSRVLSTSIAREILLNLKGLCNYDNESITVFCKEVITNAWYIDIEKSKYTDDNKVTDHYALIPTGEGLFSLDSLTECERNIYELIAQRFLSIFYPPAEYFKVQLIQEAGQEVFLTSGKYLKTKGYLKVTGYPKEDTEKKNDIIALSNLIEGQVFPCTYYKGNGETAPPKRYDSGTMILAMENAGQLIEEEELRAQIKNCGIGTSATRAETIKKLVNNEYICLNKKTQVLCPDTLGYMVYEVVAQTIPGLLNPRMTASWEKGLEGIECGTIAYSEYKEKLESYIRLQCLKIKEEDITNKIVDQIKVYAKGDSFEKEINFEERELDSTCPVCGGQMLTSLFGYKCSNSKNPKEASKRCTFNISNDICGVKLSEKEVIDLLNGKIIPEKNGFKKKDGKETFSSCLKIGDRLDQEGNVIGKQVNFYSDNQESNISCPKCSGKLLKEHWQYTCKCGFHISHTISSKKISEYDMKSLIENGKTEKLNGFISKKGKPFSATLVLAPDGSLNFKF